jgi:sigma-B regulation protein RsbU (phosphoserine phosphatase)
MDSANCEKFLTLFVGKYIISKNELQYINAGHNPPILYEKNKKKLKMLREGCVGMGMLDKIPKVEIGNYLIEEPSKLLCYTDGLVELVDEKGVEFGTENIEKHLSNPRSIQQNIQEIIKAQGILSGNQAIFDDITILGIDFKPK